MHLENIALSERSQKQSTTYGLPWVRKQGECGSTGFLFGVVSILELDDDLLKEISPGCSLEGLMLKLKLQVWPPHAKS